MPRTDLRLLAVVLAACPFLGACSRTMITDPVPTAAMADTPDATLEFWHTLPAQSAISNDEGLHGVILLVDGADPNPTYEDRVAALKQRGWIDEGFDEPANMAMQRGTLAKALAHALDIRGGVMMHLTGRAPRYAAKELSYLGVMQADATSNQVISGLDYLAIISKAQDYMIAGQVRAQAAAAAAAAARTAEPLPGDPAPGTQPAPADQPPADAPAETPAASPANSGN